MLTKLLSLGLKNYQINIDGSMSKESLGQLSYSAIFLNSSHSMMITTLHIFKSNNTMKCLLTLDNVKLCFNFKQLSILIYLQAKIMINFIKLNQGFLDQLTCCANSSFNFYSIFILILTQHNYCNYNIKMGNCVQGDSVLNPGPLKPYMSPGNGTLVSSQTAKDTAALLLNKFRVCLQLENILSRLSHTDNQASDLAKTLIQGINIIEVLEDQTERKQVSDIFTQKIISQIKKGKILYHGILKMINQNQKNISQSSKSRVYHQIANILKGQDNYQTWLNEHQFKCIRSSKYKQLSEDELQQVVKYESIAQKFRQTAKKIYFQLKSIQKDSQNMIKLLSQCLIKYIGDIKQLKYDLSSDQVEKIAEISRDACNYHQNGAFILILYFYQASNKLEEQGNSSQQIQTMLKSAIPSISAKYPPGDGLLVLPQQLKTKLTQIRMKKEEIEGFSHEKIQLKSTNRLVEVQEIIMDYAKIAQECKKDFDQLVRQTCFQKALQIKTNLKYYPNKPNQKALSRIIQKLFFRNDETERTVQGTIKQILVRQEDNYKKKLDKLLNENKQVKFTITDMVRGKCIFLQIADIIECVNIIQRFVKEDPQQRFKIQQIESRFTNKIPISDVTLKIVIKNKIVAQLQLTIQTNAATYYFAHKVYELQRTKIFSKIKITNNYHQEYSEDFNQLVSKALRLKNKTSQPILQPQNIQSIKLFFKPDSKHENSSFQTILEQVCQQKKDLLSTLSVVVDDNLQDLMMVVFSMEIGVWHKHLGKIVNCAIKKNDLSPKLKSVLLWCLFDKVQLPKESEHMKQFSIPFFQRQTKEYTEEYFRQYFQIDKAFQYSIQNQKIFHRTQQLRKIQFTSFYKGDQIQLQEDRCYLVNLVIQQNGQQIIKTLIDRFKFYFFVRKPGKNQFYDSFSLYYDWIKKFLNKNTYNDQNLLQNQIEIIKAQQLLEKEDYKTAQNILQTAQKVFKDKEDQRKVVQCGILLMECYILKEQNKSLEQFIKNYQLKIQTKASVLGIQLKGALYADSLWRVSEILTKRNDQSNKSQYKCLLQTFTSWSLKQMSRSKGKQFVYALSSKKEDFEKQGVDIEILLNPTINYIKMRDIGAVGCQYLSKAKWDNLATLNLNRNYIGDVGCSYLSKAKWDNLAILYLSENQIGDVGCQYLSKAKWVNLVSLYLSENYIGNIGCQHLSKAKWDNLATLYLNENQIGDVGCQYVSKAKWDNLINLNLSNCFIYLCENFIGDVGCQYLSKAKWDNLATLHLQGNKIEAVGRQYLSKAKWDKIATFTLRI